MFDLQNKSLAFKSQSPRLGLLKNWKPTTAMNDFINILSSRVSFSQLKAPAPDQSELKQIFQSCLNVPDHLQLRPWRFLSISGEARNKLGNLFMQAEKLQNKDCSPAQLEKLSTKALRAPLIIVAICSTQNNDKVPELEQQLSTGCVIHNLGLALFSLGYGSVWRTGKMAFDPFIKQSLGLKDQESIVGYLYVGTPAAEAKSRKALWVEDYLQDWA